MPYYGDQSQVGQQQGLFSGLNNWVGVGGGSTPVAQQLLAQGYNSQPNLSAEQGWQNQQSMLAKMQQQQAAGQGPSAAQAQLSAGVQQGIAGQLAGANATRFGQSPGQSAYNAAGQAAQMQGQAANQASQLKAQEMQSGAQNLGNTLGQGMQGALGMTGAQQTAQAPVANLYGQEQGQQNAANQALFSNITSGISGLLGNGAQALTSALEKGGVYMAGGGLSYAPPGQSQQSSGGGGGAGGLSQLLPLLAAARGGTFMGGGGLSYAPPSQGQQSGGGGGGLAQLLPLLAAARGGVYLGEKGPEIDIAPEGHASLIDHPMLTRLGQGHVVLPLKHGSAPYQKGPLPRQPTGGPSRPAPKKVALHPAALAEMKGRKSPAPKQKGIEPLSPKSAPAVKSALDRAGVKAEGMAKGGVRAGARGEPPQQLEVLMAKLQKLQGNGKKAA